MKKYIVIGGGILGASTAYQLAKVGADVLVIDRKDEGQATGAAAGIVCPWLSQRRNQAWYKLVKAGARFYPSIIAELEDEGEVHTGYEKVGAISLRKKEKTLREIEKIALKRREDAPEMGEIKVLTPAETKDLFPLVDEEFGAVYASGAARVDGRELRDALLRSAKRHGAEVIYDEAKLVLEGNKVTGVVTSEERYLAQKVIITAGAWADQLLKPLGVHFRVKDLKAQIIHMELPYTDTNGWPVVIPPGNQYIVPFQNGRIVAGATYENFTNFDLRTTAGGMHEVLEKALDIAPGLANSTVLEARVGFRPYTPESLPVIGTLPGYENVLIGNGLGATGLTIGPYFGAELAQLALGKEPEIDLDLYCVTNALQA